ncbi:MAG: PAS domain S-box protein, partial [Verrucomicrobia bacterium]|nr:PAS domain S-box protein [Verrucomicrobiota bacterium]
MNIAKRLILLLAVPLMALVSIGLFQHFQLTEVEQHSRKLAQLEIPALATIGNITRTFGEMRADLRGYLLATNDATRAKTFNEFTKDEAELNLWLAKFADSMVEDAKDRRLLEDYRNYVREWTVGAKKAMSVLAEGNREDALNRVNGFLTELAERINGISTEWIRHNESLAAAAGQEAVTNALAIRWKSWVASAAALLLTGLLGYLTFQRIARPIQALDASVKTIAAGDYGQAIPFIQAQDETGGLARSVDVLKQGAAAMEEHRWVGASAAKITGGLQGAASLAEFGQRLLSDLVPLLGGGVAGFYLFEENAGRLRRIAAYGLAEGATAADSFGLGQGLVGQCAQERTAVQLANLPADYLRIASGLGAAAPTQALASPLLSKDALLGVIEIASFRTFASREKKLLEELFPVVAMSLEILQRNLRTQELLGQTQAQARQLEEQTDELTKSQEELMAQKEELLTQQGALTAQRAELQQSEERSRLILESTGDGLFGTDAAGAITFVNPAACRLLGYTAEEL